MACRTTAILLLAYVGVGAAQSVVNASLFANRSHNREWHPGAHSNSAHTQETTTSRPPASPTRFTPTTSHSPSSRRQRPTRLSTMRPTDIDNHPTNTTSHTTGHSRVAPFNLPTIRRTGHNTSGAVPGHRSTRVLPFRPTTTTSAHTTAQFHGAAYTMVTFQATCSNALSYNWFGQRFHHEGQGRRRHRRHGRLGRRHRRHMGRGGMNRQGRAGGRLGHMQGRRRGRTADSSRRGLQGGWPAGIPIPTLTNCAKAVLRSDRCAHKIMIFQSADSYTKGRMPPPSCLCVVKRDGLCKMIPDNTMDVYRINPSVLSSMTERPRRNLPTIPPTPILTRKSQGTHKQFSLQEHNPRCLHVTGNTPYEGYYVTDSQLKFSQGLFQVYKRALDPKRHALDNEHPHYLLTYWDSCGWWHPGYKPRPLGHSSWIFACEDAKIFENFANAVPDCDKMHSYKQPFWPTFTTCPHSGLVMRRWLDNEFPKNNHPRSKFEYCAHRKKRSCDPPKGWKTPVQGKGSISISFKTSALVMTKGHYRMHRKQTLGAPRHDAVSVVSIDCATARHPIVPDYIPTTTGANQPTKQPHPKGYFEQVFTPKQLQFIGMLVLFLCCVGMAQRQCKGANTIDQLELETVFKEIVVNASNEETDFTRNSLSSLESSSYSVPLKNEPEFTVGDVLDVNMHKFFKRLAHAERRRTSNPPDDLDRASHLSIAPDQVGILMKQISDLKKKHLKQKRESARMAERNIVSRYSSSPLRDAPLVQGAHNDTRVRFPDPLTQAPNGPAPPELRPRFPPTVASLQRQIPRGGVKKQARFPQLVTDSTARHRLDITDSSDFEQHSPPTPQSDHCDLAGPSGNEEPDLPPTPTHMSDSSVSDMEIEGRVRFPVLSKQRRR